jgi:hypothetical protein
MAYAKGLYIWGRYIIHRLNEYHAVLVRQIEIAVVLYSTIGFAPAVYLHIMYNHIPHPCKPLTDSSDTS